MVTDHIFKPKSRAAICTASPASDMPIPVRASFENRALVRGDFTQIQILAVGKNGRTEMALKVSLVGPEQRDSALRLLFARFPVEEQASRLSEALKSAEKGTLNLDRLLLAEEDDRPIGAALLMLQADGVALVWPPVISCQTGDTDAVEKALMSRLCEEIEVVDAKLAQALIAPDDAFETELLKKFGFELATEMFFLAKTLEDVDLQKIGTESAETKNKSSIDTTNIELDHDLFREANANRFASVIERTYQGSRDCPFLDGFRTGSEALSSHKLSGEFDPAGWRLYRQGNEDVGVLMMNEHPEQDAIELFYFGIVPEHRGKGLGRLVLADGLQAAEITGRSVVFLAVDCENIYANALYNEFGFAELARRRVMLKRSPPLARK